MQLLSFPSSHGLMWLAAGWRLFRRQPLPLSALVVMFWMVLAIAGSVPFIGIVVAGMLAPYGAVGLMAACRAADRGELALPNVYAQPFRNPQVRIALARLGAINAGLHAIVSVVFWLLAADDISQWRVSDGQVDAASIAENIPWDALFVATVLYAPVLMAMWFAPVLVAWHRQSPAKALFASLVACWRNRGAFFTYFITLAAIALLASFAVAEMLALFSAPLALGQMLMVPFGFLLLTIVACSLWSMYVDVVKEGTPQMLPR
jgi:hypothetical protein